MTDRPGESSRRGLWLAAAIWFAVALALRLPGLASFSFWGDEVYSLERSLELFTPKMRTSTLACPLFFLVERLFLAIGGVAELPRPVTEHVQFFARLLPAIAGAAAAAAAFTSSREFLRPRERHVLAALLCFSPWLLFFSQIARFYSLEVALVVPATFDLLAADRDRDWRRGAIGATWVVVAALVHPTAVLLLGGFVVAALVAAAGRVRPLHRGLLVPLALPALFVVAALVLPPVREALLYKLNVHDAAAREVGSLLLGIGWNVGPVVAAVALLGLPSLWRRDRLVAVHVAVGVGTPTALLLGLALLHKSVDQRYLLALLPLSLLPATLLLVEVAEALAARARVAVVAAPAAALVSYLPGVLSESVDGDRHDLASAAALLRAHFDPKTDGVIAEGHALLRLYLPADFDESRLIEAPPPSKEAAAADSRLVEDARHYDEMWQECRRVWIVTPAEYDELGPAERSFQQWAWTHGRLEREFWRPRLDVHQNRLRVFTLPTTTPQWGR
jgi:hypothetical protein